MVVFEGKEIRVQFSRWSHPAWIRLTDLAAPAGTVVAAAATAMSRPPEHQRHRLPADRGGVGEGPVGRR